MTISTRFTQVRTRVFISSAVVLTLLCSHATAEVRVFSVKGVITQKRIQTANDPPNVSVFAGDVGDEFHGTFSYDTDAANESPYPSPNLGFYALLDFSIDGTPLNVSTGTEIPFLAGVLVENDFSDRLEIRGFHTPAIATPEEDGFNDYGSTSIVLRDFTGSVFDDGSLPDSIDLDDFDDTRVIGPVFGFTPIRSPRDEGVITEITLVTPQALLESLINDVAELVDSKISRGLIAKLETALARLNDANEQNDVAACNTVAAFINAVEAQAGKKIDVDDADYLISQAMRILFELGCP